MCCFRFDRHCDRFLCVAREFASLACVYGFSMRERVRMIFEGVSRNVILGARAAVWHGISLKDCLGCTQLKIE
jgi:hypothetical protein